MFVLIFLQLIFLDKRVRLDTINNPDPVVQSIVSLPSSLMVISLTVLVDSIYNILIFFAEKATHIFSAKNFSIFAYHLM